MDRLWVPAVQVGSWEQPVRVGEAMKQGKAKINQMEVQEEEKEAVEAAGGGEKSTNAELFFSATCSTVSVLYLPLTPQARPRQLLTYVGGVSAFCGSSQAFGLAIFNPYSPKHVSVYTHYIFVCKKKSAIS